MKLELIVACGSWRRELSQVRRLLVRTIRDWRPGLPILIAMLFAAPPVFAGSVAPTFHGQVFGIRPGMVPASLSLARKMRSAPR
ncbi:MAG: hypothetical protein K9J42_03290 [Sulfuritalea sp.]|nr:hypothetical protein [Sulfuritalea sp.]